MLILWDIDQTLIEAGGVSRLVYADVFRRLTGRELEHQPSFAGRTKLVKINLSDIVSRGGPRR
jgi:phosphoglycolate phosphatase